MAALSAALSAKRSGADGRASASGQGSAETDGMISTEGLPEAFGTSGSLSPVPFRMGPKHKIHLEVCPLTPDVCSTSSHDSPCDPTRHLLLLLCASFFTSRAFLRRRCRRPPPPLRQLGAYGPCPFQLQARAPRGAARTVHLGALPRPRRTSAPPRPTRCFHPPQAKKGARKVHQVSLLQLPRRLRRPRLRQRRLPRAQAQEGRARKYLWKVLLLRAQWPQLTHFKRWPANQTTARRMTQRGRRSAQPGPKFLGSIQRSETQSRPSQIDDGAHEEKKKERGIAEQSWLP